MAVLAAGPAGHGKLLTVHRELLVHHIGNTRCLLDNLLHSGYFSGEDAEIVRACPTKPDQVRKILDLVQSKGEEVSEFLLYVLQQLEDAYVDLRPWLSEIGFSASGLIRTKTVVNTDPVSRYVWKLRQQLGRDSRFILCYAQREELPLEHMYTDTVMELVGFQDESLGRLDGPAGLLDRSSGVLSELGETVLVSGDAGAGKSVLLQRLQGLWAEGRLDAGLRFSFHFRCRTFSCFREGDRVSLRDLLFRHFCCPEQDPDEVFAFLLRFPHTALFTFDGLDELHSDLDLSRAPDACCPWEPAHPLVLLASLLGGRLLGGAAKVLTARTGTPVPRRLLRKKVRLLGFSPEHVRAYVRRMFPGRGLQRRLADHLEASPSLCGLCSVPLFCWIVLVCYRHFYGVSDSCLRLPECSVTLTDIFLLLAEVQLDRTRPGSLVQRNTRGRAETLRAGRDALLALGRVAHRGLERSLFVFGRQELRASGVREGDLQLGFLRALPGPDEAQPAYEFIHTTVQAFLAAFFLVADGSVGTRDMLRSFREWAPPGRAAGAGSCFPPLPCLGGRGAAREEPWKSRDHLQFTNLFLCGLLSKDRRALLRPLVPAAELRRKRRALWARLSSSLRAYLGSLPRVRSGGFSQVQAMPTFLWMARCIYETQSEKVGRLAARGVCADYLKLTYCDACSADCSALAFLLHHLRRPLALDLDNNSLGDYGVRELRPCFSRLTVVRLSVNQITDAGVKVLYEELTKYKILTFLGLYNNQITDVGAGYVARILEECRGLTHVKLGANKITCEGGKRLAVAVKNSKWIVDLGMWGNRIGDEGAKAFAEALRNHPSLGFLSLAFNGISAEGGKCLAQALQQNTALKTFWLTKNELNDEAAECLAEMLRVNQTLEHLWLIQNQITAKGVAQLAAALRNNTGIVEICVNGNLLGPEEAKVFASEKRIVCS
ncbi:nucleotide-binding oligomerization domain-containing protein 1 [Erinaceus europaeus]|uniref:Nucleotide-binding oligomerization domain-containing protein 1 n=1 Tax=Erinaceus europaeus TaxID=9365 RepID=A0ABM3XSI1_ERIEU|nr:nucleotide-binding oligomerization domain-containing protein 1 [Erinaceus europaeus]